MARSPSNEIKLSRAAELPRNASRSDAGVGAGFAAELNVEVIKKLLIKTSTEPSAS
jgi:hypothetical protein